jgi:O-antigen ligase
MSLYLFFVLPIIGAVALGTLLFPTLGMLYLAADNWVIGKITDLGDFLPFLSINKLMVLLIFLATLMQVATQRMSTDRRIFFSATTIITFVFLSYLLASSLFIMGRGHPDILNNIAFFIVMLLYFSTGGVIARARTLSWVLVAASALIIARELVERILLAGTILADVSDGGRIQPGFHVALAIPILVFLGVTSKRRWQKWIAITLIAVFIAFVALRISRTLSAILVWIALFYSVRGYIRAKWLLLLIPVLMISLTGLMATKYGEQLVRMPVPYGSSKNLSEDDLQAFTSGRSALYPIAWRRFVNNPVLGVGYDSFRHPRHAPITGGASVAQSALHSTWLQVLSETGVIGVLIYLLLYLIVYANYRVVRRRTHNDPMATALADVALAGASVFMIGGLFDNFGFEYRIFYIFIALSAALTTAVYGKKLALANSPKVTFSPRSLYIPPTSTR